MPNFSEHDVQPIENAVQTAETRLASIKRENYAYQVGVPKTRPKKLYSKAFGMKLHYRKTVQEPYTDIETRYREEEYQHDLAEAREAFIEVATDEQRTNLLIDLFGTEGAEPMINTILARGVDMDFALVQSMRTNNVAFFEFLLAQGANCDQAMIEDEGANITIVSYVAKHHAQLLDQTIQAAEVLTNTFLAAVRAGDMDLLRSIVNLKVDLVREILEQENMFREILAQDNAEMTELFLAHVDIGAEIVNLISENSDKCNGFIADLLTMVDLSLVDSSLVFHALKENNLDAVRLLLNEDNLMDTAVMTIADERLDLLTILVEERPEIMQEEIIADVVQLYRAQGQRGAVAQDDEEILREVFARYDMDDGVDVDIHGGHDFYADLE